MATCTSEFLKKISARSIKLISESEDGIDKDETNVKNHASV